MVKYWTHTFYYFLSKLDWKMSANVVWSNTSNNSLWHRTMKAQLKIIRSAFSDLWPLAKTCINLQSVSSRKWINLSNKSEVCHFLPYSLLSSQLSGSLEMLQTIIMVKSINNISATKRRQWVELELLQNPVPGESLLFDLPVVPVEDYIQDWSDSELSQYEQPFHRHICWK